MPDPLSVTAGVVGLLATAAHVIHLLANFTSSAIHAPESAQNVLSEVKDIERVLRNLQKFLDGELPITQTQARLTKVEDVFTILVSMVTTFSDLTKLLDKLKTSGMALIDRMKWVRKEKSISEILHRLERNKSTMSMMLVSFQCHKLDEINQRVAELQAMVRELRDSDPRITQRLETMEGQHPKAILSPMPLRPLQSSEGTSLHTTESTRSFEDDLQSSRVYNKSSVTDSGPSSVFSSRITGTSRTSYSGLSLADTNVADMALPIYAKDIHNSHLYKFDSHDARQHSSSEDDSEDNNEESTKEIPLDLDILDEQQRKHTTTPYDSKQNEHGSMELQAAGATDAADKTEIQVNGVLLAQSILLALILRHDNVVPFQDIQHCLELRLSDREKQRATWVSSSDQLKRWLEDSAQPRTFLINGRNFDQASDYTSHLSWICAKLSHFNKAAELTIVISYFCGLHASRDASADAKGMMHSLTGQLLSKGVFDLSSFDDETLKKVRKDIRITCDLFCQLALQLPVSSRLFCIIDTISQYESSGKRKETRLAMRRLVRLARKLKNKVCLRLLVTAPGQSLEIVDEVDFDDILDVPDDHNLGTV
ncbi:hypothetical protein N431DRAFT_552430 [Stipitochalara longipes BDJ]|nr:hypothetical protein N431DRAFT_552430 [Stipitochalara longipes BDJ]